MNHRTTPSTIELLLMDYILTIREQSTQQTRILGDYLHNITRQSNNINNLLTRWLEIIDSNEGNNQNRNNNVFSFGTASTGSTPNQPINIFNPRNTFNRSFQQSPINSTSIYQSRRNNRNITINRNRRISRPTRSNITSQRRRNILNQILETTLYTPVQRRPASARDISRNVTYHYWRDISNSTDQTLDPITQENFQPDDRVARIDHCGHLFMEDALNTYFTEFDHRCPMCRYNISSSIFPPTTYADAASRPPTLSRQNAFEISSPFDISYNFQHFPPLDVSSNLTTSNLTTTNFGTAAPTFQLDFSSGNFDNAINQLSNAMISSLSSALSNPDNSGNTIAAEYSLYVPTSRQLTDNSTNTEDAAGEADTDDETY
tara:strand:- start:493 stop:1617 length:1125 start_codon:yes stop_codon:yes gene_type:complete